jgi:transposase
MYIRYKPIFPFEEILQFDPETRLVKILSQIDLSEICSKLPKPSNFGPKVRNREAMLYSLIAMKIENIKTVKALVIRLKSDPVFRYNCGFSFSDPIPSESRFSRFTDQIVESAILQVLFNNLVEQAIKLGMIEGSSVAIDSSEYESYDAAKPSSKIEKNGQNPDWGSKRDSDGNQIRWFGWKLHTAVDCKSGLPLALIVTSASTADCVMAIPLIEQIKAKLKDQLKTEFYIMDRGYDSKEIYQTIQETYKAQAIIPLNHRGAYAPPEGLDEKGTPICSMGYSMTYWGHEGECHKFRCPHITGKVDCPQGSNWCSNSNYGHVVKLHVEDDPRMFPIPHRCTNSWQKLYNQRTAVERCFSMLKEHLGLENLTKCGMKKAIFNALLSCIVMLAGAISTKNNRSILKAE